MFHFPLFEPRAQILNKELIFKILAPESAILHAGFGQAPIQIQQTDQPGPCPTPVCDRENWPLVRDQTPKQMLTVLPNSLRHDERRLLRYRLKTPNPIFCESMNPCPFVSSNGCARLTLKPSR